MGKSKSKQKQHKRGLTPKQTRFIREYLIDLNATQAAIRAGYSKRTAKDIACENLAKPNIQEVIKTEVGKMLTRADVKGWMVIKELQKLAFSNIGDFATWSKGTLTFASAKEIPRELMGAISEISETPNGGIRIKLHGKEGPLKLLGEYLKLFSDKFEGEKVESKTVFVAPEMADEESWVKLTSKS